MGNFWNVDLPKRKKEKKKESSKKMWDAEGPFRRMHARVSFSLLSALMFLYVT